MATVTDCGDILPVQKIAWARSQCWAPDMIQGPDGRIYAYFPARAKKDGRFRIGVAVADKPEGPYEVEENPIEGTYSIDPGMLIASDGSVYMYWGGLLGGELQNYPQPNSEYRAGLSLPESGTPLRCRVAKLRKDMKTIDADGVRDIVVNDENGTEIQAQDENRLFFEGPFVYEREHDGEKLFYLLYSTGFTHYIQHATSTSPLGPFTWRGMVLSPPKGWTTQVSVAEYNGKSWLFYHDASRSGQTHLRDVKFQELRYRANGSIKSMIP